MQATAAREAVEAEHTFFGILYICDEVSRLSPTSETEAAACRGHSIQRIRENSACLFDLAAISRLPSSSCTNLAQAILPDAEVADAPGPSSRKAVFCGTLQSNSLSSAYNTLSHMQNFCVGCGIFLVSFLL